MTENRPVSSSLGQDEIIREPLRPMLESTDDGVTHLRDEHSHSWDGNKRPHHEEGPSRIRFWGEIAVSDGDQRAKAEVETFEIGHTFEFPEDNGSAGPDYSEDNNTNEEIVPAAESHGLVLDCAHSVKPVFFFSHDQQFWSTTVCQSVDRVADWLVLVSRLISSRRLLMDQC